MIFSSNGTVVIEHDGKELIIPVHYKKNQISFKRYKKTPTDPTKSQEEGVFQILNDYIESLPATKVNHLFKVLEKYTVDLHNPMTTSIEQVAIDILYDKVVQDVFSVESTMTFIDANVPVPSDILKDYVPQDISFSEEKTFVVADYKNFISLIIMLKFLIPIIGSYFAMIEEDQIRPYVKIYGLLPQWVTNHRGFVKVARYLESNISNNAYMEYHVFFHNVASDDIVHDELCNIMLGSIPALPGYNDCVGHHTITWLAQMCKKDTAPSKIIDEKKPTVSDVEDGGNSSMLQAYTARAPLTIQEVELMKYYADPAYYLNHVDNITEKDITMVQQAIDKKGLPLETWQETLIMIVLSEKIHHTVFNYVPAVKLVPLAYHVLNKTGYHDLAIAITCKRKLTANGDFINDVASKARLDATFVSYFNKVNPAVIPTKKSPVLITIDKISNLIGNYQLTNILDTDDVIVGRDIRNRIGALFMDVSKGDLFNRLLNPQ